MIKQSEKKSTRSKRKDAVSDNTAAVKASIEKRGVRQTEAKEGSSTKHTDPKYHCNGGIITRMNKPPE